MWVLLEVNKYIQCYLTYFSRAAISLVLNYCSTFTEGFSLGSLVILTSCLTKLYGHTWQYIQNYKMIGSKICFKEKGYTCSIWREIIFQSGGGFTNWIPFPMQIDREGRNLLPKEREQILPYKLAPGMGFNCFRGWIISPGGMSSP